MKEAENTETSPLNDVRHRKFLVYPGKLIISSNKLKSKFQEESWWIFSEKRVSKYRLTPFNLYGKNRQKHWKLTFKWRMLPQFSRRAWDNYYNQKSTEEKEVEIILIRI